MKILMGKNDDEVLVERKNEHFIDYLPLCFSNMILLCFLRFVIGRCESLLLCRHSSYRDNKS